jgi:hypothetical protein
MKDGDKIMKIVDEEKIYSRKERSEERSNYKRQRWER